MDDRCIMTKSGEQYFVALTLWENNIMLNNKLDVWRVKKRLHIGAYTVMKIWDN